MKILFSADWHIKLNTKNIPNEWQINRYKLLFEQLHTLEKQVDIHIIGGDIFDKLPNMEELSLYFDFISGVKVKTIIYPGNHEALKKNTSFLSYLKTVTFNLNPLVTICDEIFSFADVDIIPYNELKNFVTNYQDYDFHGKVLCTHVRGEIPPHVKAEIPLELLEKWEIVLAGDLHSYDNCQRNILYPGSPVTTSFHRNVVDTGVIILNLDTLEHSWVKVDVPQLVRKTVKVGEPMEAGDYHHIIYEVEGSLDELSQVQNSELLDKKITKKDTDTALILSPEMTIEEEIVDYMKYILQVSDETIEKALKQFHDSIKNIKME